MNMQSTTYIPEFAEMPGVRAAAAAPSTLANRPRKTTLENRMMVTYVHDANGGLDTIETSSVRITIYIYIYIHSWVSSE